MRRLLSLCPAGSCALLALVVSSCVRIESDRDKSKVQISVPGASVSVSGDADGGEVTVQAPGTTVKVTGDADGGQVSITAPGAEIEAGTEPQLSEEEAGVPFYPGAVHAGTAFARAGDSQHFEIAFHTDDAVAEVEDYYDEQLSTADGWRLRKHLTPGFTEAEYKRPEGADLRQDLITDQSGSTVIRIRFGDPEE